MRRVCSSVGRSAGRLVAGVVAVFGFAAVPAVPAVAADCPNAGIRAAQGPVVEALPDCMGLELVSPARKFSQGARSPSVSADGGRVVFRTLGGVGDPPGMVNTFFGDAYVASRGEGGWDVAATVPPDQPGEDMSLSKGWQNEANAASFSPDFSRWLTIAATTLQYNDGVGQAFAGGLGGFFEPVSPLLAPLDGLHGTTNLAGTELQGASANHSRLFFRTGDLSTAYLPGDLSPSGSGAESNVYVAGLDDGAPSLGLLARDGDGKVWGGRCGARLGGRADNASSGGGRDQGAVAYPDGGRVYFQTRPGQVGAGVCDSAANRLRIMERVEAEDGPSIGELFASECDRVAPVCDATDGDDFFQGASVDGERVYFTTTRQLADSDLDTGAFGSCSTFFAAPGCDLYLYDRSLPAGQRLVQVSAGDETNPTPGSGAGVLDEIAAVSGDGSHVYFVAEGVLTTDPSPTGAVAVAGQRNFYVFQRDEGIAFVGAAAATDGLFLWAAFGTFKGTAYPVPVTGEDAGGDEVGGDGHVLVFQSYAAFTADDSDGGELDVFRYDATADEIERLSKAAPGGADNGPIDVDERGNLFLKLVGTEFAESGRWVSEDADTVVMRTQEGWAADDTNGVYDSYMWRDGQLYRLPGSTDGSFLGANESRAERQPAVSHDGSVVAYVTPSQVLAGDGDLVGDVYVARVNGGYESPDPGLPCDPLADSCPGDGAGEMDADRKTGGSSGGNAPAVDRVRLAVGGLTAAQRRRAARRGVLALRVRVSAAKHVSVVVRGRVGRSLKRLGSASKTIAGAGVVRVRLAKPARDRLRVGRGLRLSVLVTADGVRSRSLSVLLPRTGK